MKKIVLTLIAVLALATSYAQKDYKPSKSNLESRKEFADSRFGVFLHWGVYSMLGQGEWVMNSGIDYKEYSKLAGAFYPSKFDADKWVAAIKKGGAKYICITTRHHDGFSLFKSAASSYNAVDATPFKRDIIGEIAKACEKQGLRLHLYYSHLDWGRTDYFPRGRTGLRCGRPDGKPGDWEHYLDFLNSQLRELLTQYGKIGAIWFDGFWDLDQTAEGRTPEKWGLYRQYKLIHDLQPACLIGNNHHGLPFSGEDIQIFERDIPGQNTAGWSSTEISQFPLETCQTMNDSWGYRATDKNYKSTEELIHYLVNTAGMNANLLLNIGPRPNGELPDEALERLNAMGEWLDAYGETIYGTEGGIVKPCEWGATTQRGNKMYVHILKYGNKDFLLPYNGNTLKSAVVYKDKRPVKFKKTAANYLLTFDEVPSGVDYVIELTFASDISKTPRQ